MTRKDTHAYHHAVVISERHPSKVLVHALHQVFEEASVQRLRALLGRSSNGVVYNSCCCRVTIPWNNWHQECADIVVVL